MPSKVVIEVPGIPPSLNDWMRWHPMARHQENIAWKKKVAMCCLVARAKPMAGPVQVTLTYFFPTRQHRDLDNYAGKFILDGLRPSVISDDSSDVVRSLVIRFEHDPTNPRVEVVVERLR